jgi:hypothetical protein
MTFAVVDTFFLSVQVRKKKKILRAFIFSLIIATYSFDAKEEKNFVPLRKKMNFSSSLF